MPSFSIDLNCDMGEMPGAQDEEIMAFVSSINIACGFHAGDASTMRQTAKLAIQKGLNIGAHPSFFDLEGFGRRNMELAPEEVYAIVVQQIETLKIIVESEGGKLTHVKPHGALYNMAAQDFRLAEALAQALIHVDRNLVFVGLAGSQLIKAGRRVQLRTMSEVFADRTYLADGSLTPRSLPDAFVTDPRLAASKILSLLTDKRIEADTVCIHSDLPHALSFAQNLYHELARLNIHIKKPS